MNFMCLRFKNTDNNKRYLVLVFLLLFSVGFSIFRVLSAVWLTSSKQALRLKCVSKCLSLVWLFVSKNIVGLKCCAGYSIAKLSEPRDRKCKTSFTDNRGSIIGRKYISFWFLDLNLHLSPWAFVIYKLFIESVKVFEGIVFGGLLTEFIVHTWTSKYG